MKFNQNQKLNLPLAHPPTVTDESSERKLSGKSKQPMKLHVPDSKTHQMRDLLFHAEHKLVGHEDLTETNASAEHGEMPVIILRIQRTGPTSILAESSGYSAQIGKAR